jgi:hypothetical protein
MRSTGYVYVYSFELLNHLTDFHEIGYEYYAIAPSFWTCTQVNS